MRFLGARSLPKCSSHNENYRYLSVENVSLKRNADTILHPTLEIWEVTPVTVYHFGTPTGQVGGLFLYSSREVTLHSPFMREYHL